MYVQPIVMRVCFPHHIPFSRNAVLDLHSPTRVSCSSGKQRLFLTVLCSIPARDVVVDFGKYKGCRMGTLPSGYLRWLVGESHQSSLAVWGDYAKQVLEDPYYRDRLEWQNIEKLSARGDMGKGSPLAASAGVKGCMMDLGWDLSDRHAWSKVNFSLLGTTAGGRIPRKELNQSLPNPKLAIPKLRTLLPKSTREDDTGSSLSRSKLQPCVPNLKSRSTNSIGSSKLTRMTVPSGNSPPCVSNLKSTSTNSIGSSKLTSMTVTTGDSPPSRSLTLREELLRRRRLRKERSAPKFSSTVPPTTENVKNLFPGRDSLLKRARRRVDT